MKKNPFCKGRRQQKINAKRRNFYEIDKESNKGRKAVTKIYFKNTTASVKVVEVAKTMYMALCVQKTTWRWMT